VVLLVVNCDGVLDPCGWYLLHHAVQGPTTMLWTVKHQYIKTMAHQGHGKIDNVLVCVCLITHPWYYSMTSEHAMGKQTYTFWSVGEIEVILLVKCNDVLVATG